MQPDYAMFDPYLITGLTLETQEQHVQTPQVQEEVERSLELQMASAGSEPESGEYTSPEQQIVQIDSDDELIDVKDRSSGINRNAETLDNTMNYELGQSELELNVTQESRSWNQIEYERLVGASMKCQADQEMRNQSNQ